MRQSCLLLYCLVLLFIGFDGNLQCRTLLCLFLRWSFFCLFLCDVDENLRCHVTKAGFDDCVGQRCVFRRFVSVASFFPELFLFR